MFISYQFKSSIPGSNILVIGSIHGDEVCGSKAIEKLREEIIKGKLKIQNGSITCIPYANHTAYLRGKRQNVINLNRVFGEYEKDGGITTDEITVIEEIKNLIDTADFVLDLHSFPSGKDIPFIFKDIEDNVLDEVFTHIPIEYIVEGWNSLYQDSYELDTIGYTSKLTKIGFCLECGLTGSPTTEKVAFESILGVLSYFGIIDAVNLMKSNFEKKRIRAHSIIRKPKGGHFIKPWRNFDKISQNTVIGIDIDGKEICSDKSGYILIPNSNVEEGGEWCYLGTASKE